MLDRATPTLRATAPALRFSGMTATRPAEREATRLAAATESSRDALSTNMIGYWNVSRRRSSVAHSSWDRSRVAMTNDVGVCSS
ncbi:hypothetical protein A5625_13265 [Mycobacterium sp. 1465703.0]|nr:hypothetical protein A5625_13265 [Mycobacterium sp. 1465703.0]